MYNFNFKAVENLDEASQLYQADEEAKILAGGQTLIPTLKQRLASPSTLIKISDISELKGIELDGNYLVIRSMTTHADVAFSDVVHNTIPALSKLASIIGDPQVRNRGTLGGSIANSDPAADYPAACLGLNAKIITDKREILADDYFLDLFETALEDDEIIKEVHFAVPEKASYQKFPNPASGYAVVGVFVAKYSDNTIRVAVTGAGPCAFRLSRAEELLSQSLNVSELDKVEVECDRLNEDIHASQEYRGHLIKVLLKRAIMSL